MGLGAAVMFCIFIGCMVAMFVAEAGDRRTLRGTAVGLITVLIVAYLIAPLAPIGDPYFFESQLRLTALTILPLIAFALLGSWVRKMRLRRGHG